MAHVERFIGSKTLGEYIAKMPEVQGEMDRVLTEAAMGAGRELAEHRHDDHATIEVEKWGPDRALILSDTRGQKAAMSIEYGRQANDSGRGGMAGLFILHKALSLTRRKKKRLR